MDVLETIRLIAGLFFLIFGVVFSFLGVFGILRLPDTYSRLHASGKVGTLGVIGLCIGCAFLMPSAALKVLALSIFLVFSGPVGSHAIAAGIHRAEQTNNPHAEAPVADTSATPDKSTAPVGQHNN